MHHAALSVVPPKDPIERLLAAFLAGRGPHTTDAYTRDLDVFTRFVRQYTLVPGTHPIGSAHHDYEALRWFFALSLGQVNEIAHQFKNELLARGKAPGTTARRISVLKSLVKYARMTGLVTWTIEVQAPRIEHVRDTRGPGIQTVQQMLALAAKQAAPANTRDVALLRLAYDLALRISELARLDVADLELKTGGIWIFGKGRRAKELITMPPTSREAVKAWLEARGNKPGPLLVSLSPSNRGGRLVRGGVYRIIRNLGAAAGAHVRPHGIRHTAITQAIDLAAKHGLSIDVVRHFSRHKDLSTLMIYRDELENKQREIAGWV